MNHLSTCRICGVQNNHKVYDVREMMFGTREVFRYFQCTACGCLQIKEIPDALGRFYPPDYYSLNLKPERGIHSTLYRKLQKQRCRTALFGEGFKLNSLLKKHVELPEALFERAAGISTGEVLRKSGIKDFSARFVDVGCGAHSNWLMHLSALGFYNLIGVDPFIKADIQRGNIRIYKGELGNVHGQFDLITLNHSLEHMPQQLEILQEIRARLSKAGICLVRIPVVSSYVWEKYGVNWVELDAPRHLYLHSLDSIIYVAQRAGLVLKEVVYDSLPLEFYGSEQYLRDIPLNDPDSLWVNPDSNIFTAQEKASFATLSTKVNVERCGGRAGFYFQADSST